jgi:hypothetical protein
MNPFNEENVTENMCIEVAQKAGYVYYESDILLSQSVRHFVSTS